PGRGKRGEPSRPLARSFRRGSQRRGSVGIQRNNEWGQCGDLVRRNRDLKPAEFPVPPNLGLAGRAHRAKVPAGPLLLVSVIVAAYESGTTERDDRIIRKHRKHPVDIVRLPGTRKGRLDRVVAPLPAAADGALCRT